MDKIKLDYSLQTPEERNELVKKIIDNNSNEKFSSHYLEILSDYIIFAMDKQERKEKTILTENRLVTVNKRETSFQGLSEQLQGEDGIYNLIANDKNIIFTPKISITSQDMKTIPGLKELRELIIKTDAECKIAKGKSKYILKKQLIEMRQDQYVLKYAYSPPIPYASGVKSFPSLNLSETIVMDENGEPHSNCLVDLFNPIHISALLQNYSAIKEEVYGKFDTDSYYLMIDLENLIDEALKEKYPLYYDLLIYKIDGKPNLEIQQLLDKKYSIRYSVEYISSLWRKKIPKLIAEKAKENYIVWYYLIKEKGKWKKCSRCGQVKLVHNRFFSKNKSSRDGFYSICKECRNKKKEGTPKKCQPK